MWLPVRRLLGKVPPDENKTHEETGLGQGMRIVPEEEKHEVRQDLEVVDYLKHQQMSSLEQALIIKCLSMNTLVEDLNWSGNKIEASVIMSMSWLFEISKSLERVDLHACGLDASSWMARLSVACLTRASVNSKRPNMIRLSRRGGFLPVQRLLGREDIGFSMHLAEPVHILDDMFVANLVWLSAYHISSHEGTRLENHDMDEVLLRQQNIRHAFDKYDTDRSGELDMKELKVAIMSLGFDPENLAQNIEEMDLDGNGQFNFPEFQELMLQAMDSEIEEGDNSVKTNSNLTSSLVAVDNSEGNDKGRYKPYVGILSSVTSANGVHIESSQQLVDYAKQPLKLFQISYISTQLRPSDVCNVRYLSFEACGLDVQEVYANSPTALLCHALCSNRSVTDLNLADNRIGSSHDVSVSFRRLLSSNNRLLRLDLSHNPLGFQCRPAPSSSSRVTSAIAMGLVLNTNLRSLSLSDCGLQPKGVESLGRALLTNSSLRELDISRNSGVTRYGAVALGKGLEVNTGLEILNAKGCSIGMCGATALAKMLRVNKTLTDLNIGGNPHDKRDAAVQCYGALAISLALRANTTLKALHMPSSGIEEAGATYMAHMLAVNTTLLTLDLDGVIPSVIEDRQPPKPAVRKDDPNLDSLIFEEIDIHAAAALETFDKKQEMDMRAAIEKQQQLRAELQYIAGQPAFDGRIGAQGAIAISAALKRNKNLTMLSLAQNNIGNEGASSLLNSISQHNSLISLDITGAMINEQCVDKLVKALDNRGDGHPMRYLLVTGSELGREAVTKIQKAAKGIVVQAFEDSPLLATEQLDADDDPLQQVREVSRKVREKQDQKALRSRFVVYSDDFPYESKILAIQDDFRRCPEEWQERLRAAARLDNPAPLQKLIDELENLTPEAITTTAEKGPNEKYKRRRHT